jgi:hypothetical protein
VKNQKITKQVLFCQFSNVLLNQDKSKIDSKFYEKFYKQNQNLGFYKNQDFFEVPLWISEINGSLKNSNFVSSLHIIKDMEETINFIKSNNFDLVLFSALDVNKQYIKNIVESNLDQNFVLGGYIDFSYFKNNQNIKIFKTVKSFIKSLKIDYVYDLDYSLFKNYKTVPRLTLSLGCSHHCKFCTIPNKIESISLKNIVKQYQSFKNLDFKLVYLNDKTFGQNSNYKLLKLIYNHIKKFNPGFQGFIVQTTANLLTKKRFVKNLENLKVKYVEFGFETYNNKILKKFRKPQTEKIINKAMHNLKKSKLSIIPNLIIGLIGEDKTSYKKTLTFLKQNQKDIFSLNLYNLALYRESNISETIKNIKNSDLIENNTNKSFYSSKQLKENQSFNLSVYNFAFKLLEVKK